ncbi:hypothetical protein AI46_01800 [Burkholderia multivorans R-20526]|nr:hypothetical protein AI46_01800 [Burkholderia multivorans R-20526]
MRPEAEQRLQVAAERPYERDRRGVLFERRLIRGDDAARVADRAARESQVVIRTLLVRFGEIAVRAFVDDQPAVAPREPDEIRGLPRAEVGAAFEDVDHALERRRRPDRPELAPLIDVVQLVVEHHAANELRAVARRLHRHGEVHGRRLVGVARHRRRRARDRHAAHAGDAETAQIRHHRGLDARFLVAVHLRDVAGEVGPHAEAPVLREVVRRQKDARPAAARGVAGEAGDQPRLQLLERTRQFERAAQLQVIIDVVDGLRLLLAVREVGEPVSLVDQHGADVQRGEPFVERPRCFRTGPMAGARVAVGEWLVVVHADHNLLAAQRREVERVNVAEAAQRERGRTGQCTRVDRQRVDRALDDEYALRLLQPPRIRGPAVARLVALRLRFDAAVQRGIHVAHVDGDDAAVARRTYDERGSGPAVADFAGGNFRARPRVEPERACRDRRVDRGGGNAAAAEVFADMLALGEAAIGDVFDGRFLAALGLRRPVERNAVGVVQVAHGVRHAAAAHVNHQIDARPADAGAVIAPAGAMLRVIHVDRQRRVLVRVLRRMVERLVAAAAALKAEAIGEVVQVDALFQFVDRSHRYC